MSSSLSAAQSEIKELASEVSSLKSQISSASKSVISRQNQLNALLKLQKFAREDIKTLSAFPGIKQPKWYSADIDFEYGDFEEKVGQALISADSAFVCTQVQSYFIVKDTDLDHYPENAYLPLVLPTHTAQGRVLPCSGLKPYMGDCLFNDIYFSGVQGFGFIFAPHWGQLYPELDFKIEVMGTGRYWASQWVPSFAFFGAQSPFYLGYEGVVENSDRLAVYANPTVPMGLKGTVRFVFHGYSISSKVSTQALIGQ